ncbi:Exodeoxyribonuclease VII small subunit [Malonomonas rubra DSM 5091]|uniref:Exodeoxyribonuclease 7 small subunit n=1 Tax=Malonomonas rubra DSM 5091 TaxID=1122189 RepID=A0A1M6BBY1_MALRU|nr:exodeoxyribonuclease VII small subunit [Malonomonas rubra]SHI46088.1 Exodeoxyribonuclease VII small subunit [Malonomonas rubra DSM 5091]
MAKKSGFETALKQLEDAVTQLESGELSLEQSLKVFSTGVEQADACRKSLQDVELQVEQLLKQADGSFTREAFLDED